MPARRRHRGRLSPWCARARHIVGPGTPRAPPLVPRPARRPGARLLSSIGDDGARFDTALAVEGADGLVDGAVELAGVAEGAVGQVVALQVAPRPFDVVQLCALRRCTGSVGASPTRQLSLQPEAPGADQEVTNGLKHLGKRPLSGASGPCGPQRERTPSRPRKCPMWEPTHQLNGEGRRRRASERDTPPPIPPG
jgi:hypothetical protein